MVEFEVPEVDYTQYSNRQLVAVPLVVLAVALIVLAGWWAMTGSPVALGVDFTGGSEVRIETTLSQQEIRQSFDEPVVSVQGIERATDDDNVGNQYVVTFDSSDIGAIRDTVDSNEQMERLQSGTTSPLFGAENQRLAVLGVGVAFLGMSLLAFAFFRTFVPSIAIVVSAFSDIVIPVAIMNLVGIKLSLGTVAALLMLIGYSVDSDILLNNHVLRRSGGFYESTYRAMRTGVTMTLTSIAAMAVMAVTATLFGIELMASIGIVLVLGLTADLMNTYMLNVTLLRWYKYEGVNR
ncbi:MULTISPECIES: protein translocase subunit SecF [Haloarcula]|uniref:Protein-export membrane protein SecF n=1 Tax=Haloarcula pellucida TaxID=1427151 RepID=A0A830GKI9_9EURY|nr:MULTISPECIES: protein translocase subunit SecF [Halomicroarcula]MBX0348779.1 protein translocase subunit SecF [Halomicroarcula pellucida]MDS0278547.1 protein translocase subunit SecF [Halomicroarcula sp. S1AR25-4]GGN91843.1 preprotein translocase subunit SecF [Halomicroarcula pellucida]